jgi:hypothetical protein
VDRFDSLQAKVEMPLPQLATRISKVFTRFTILVFKSLYSHGPSNLSATLSRANVALEISGKNPAMPAKPSPSVPNHPSAGLRPSVKQSQSCSELVLIYFLVIFALFTINPDACAEQPDATEYQVKAAYLYNFGKFVAWPDISEEGTDRRFAICVLGEDPFGPVLDSAIAGATIRGNGVVARRIAKPQEIDGCRILFISNSERDRLQEVLMAIDKARVLTVSDIPQFSEHGGMIQFVLDRSRVRFEINVTNAENAGLNLSSELLKVATRVTRTTRPGM